MDHKVFIHSNTLQIYCIACKREIEDDEYEIVKQLRKMIIGVDPEQEKILFAGQREYPPAFVREKVGLCGLIGKDLNGYVSSVIQLFGHAPPIADIFQQLSMPEIYNPKLRLFSQTIKKIKSGTYRISQIIDLEKMLESSGVHHKFREYKNKTPASLIYELLKYIVQEFQYIGPACQKKQIISPQQKTRQPYSPVHSFFSGAFRWKGICEKCKHIEAIDNDFECIRLQCGGIRKNETIELEDLTHHTFHLQENNPFINKRCVKCKNSEAYIKFSKQDSGIRFPNLLFLEFQTQQDLKIHLPSTLDLNPYTTSEQGYIYEYMGSIGKQGRKYLSHVRQGEREYIFNDAIIKQDAQKLLNVRVALYRLPANRKNTNICKNVSSCIEVDVSCIVPLPDFWFSYLQNLRIVQPLVNPFICTHGLIKPNTNSKTASQLKIPVAVYEFLVEEFGGTKISDQFSQQPCTQCCQKLDIIEQIKHSEKQMAKFADQMSNRKNKVCIDTDWLAKWRKYLYEECRVPYQNSGNARPGPINNKNGLNQQNQVIEEKYKKISPEVWYFLKRFYGGGPLIAKNVSKPCQPLVQAVDLRYQNIKDKIDYLLKL